MKFLEALTFVQSGEIQGEDIFRFVVNFGRDHLMVHEDPDKRTLLDILWEIACRQIDFSQYSSQELVHLAAREYIHPAIIKSVAELKKLTLKEVSEINSECPLYEEDFSIWRAFEPYIDWKTISNDEIADVLASEGHAPTILLGHINLQDLDDKKLELLAQNSLIREIIVDTGRIRPEMIVAFYQEDGSCSSQFRALIAQKKIPTELLIEVATSLIENIEKDSQAD